MQTKSTAKRLASVAARLSAAACLAFTTSALAQTTWYVDASAPGPGDGSPSNPYDSIQYAIEQSTTVDGDTLLVLPGVYEETVDYLGKTVAIRASGGPDVTTILVPQGFPSRAVLVTSGEGPGTSLEGFEITGDGKVPQPDRGAGVRLVDSTLTLRDCRIVDVGSHTGNVMLSVGLYAENSTLEAVDCVIRDHSDYDYGWGAGMGLVNTTAEFVRCEILGNVSGHRGGAVWIQGGVVEFLDCDIAHSACWYHGGALHVEGGAAVSLVRCRLEDNQTIEAYRGGAVYALNSTLQVEDCQFASNLGSEGGALYLSGTGGTVRGSSFDGNIAAPDPYTMVGWGQGGAIYGGTNLTIERCVFVGNRASGSSGYPGLGGAVLSDATFDRCSFFGNWARDDGGAVYSSGTVSSSILWGGDPNEVGGGASIEWSDVAGGYAGTGNTDVDPRFWSTGAGDLHLRWNSPCIDAGDPSTFDSDGSVADMGAFPFDPRYGDPIGTTTCTSNPNSTGQPAVLDAFGVLSVADNDLFFRVTGLPPGKFGYFLLSATPTFVPLFGGGQGDLCVGSPQIRFNKDVLSSGSAGTVWFQPDLTDLPQGTTILPGEDWFFQLWYRDSNPQITHNTSSANQLLFE